MISIEDYNFITMFDNTTAEKRAAILKTHSHQVSDLLVSSCSMLRSTYISAELSEDRCNSKINKRGTINIHGENTVITTSCTLHHILD